MVNTGTWNSDFAVFLFLLMMAPIFLAGLANLLQGIFADSQGSITMTTEITKQEEEPKITFEDIKRATLLKAAQGDKSARDWVTKHVFCPIEETIKSENLNIQTKQSIISDAIDAMVAVGFDKNKSKNIVLNLVKNKTYKDASVLFRDAIKRK